MCKEKESMAHTEKKKIIFKKVIQVDRDVDLLDNKFQSTYYKYFEEFLKI